MTHGYLDFRGDCGIYIYLTFLCNYAINSSPKDEYYIYLRCVGDCMFQVRSNAIIEIYNLIIIYINNQVNIEFTHTLNDFSL